ncbi:MAG: DsrE/DsrF/DrsH-like family protein [Reichenbachiella sp.]|uniref:DsrE/DsrF/DrsH-like family protein n=1 Tax=Reichenbachiella sp. TaxID=2184521 RepID=UPI0032655873
MEDVKEMTADVKKNIEEKKPLKKVLVICARGTLEDVYAALIMANGALSEGKEAKMFFTFFGLDAITKAKADHLHTATVGNPAFMRSLPTMVGGLPGFEALASHMMKQEMDKLDIPPVTEFLEMIEAGGGEIYACKLAADMFHIKKEDLVDEVKDIITVGQMYDLAEGDGVQIIYV